MANEAYGNVIESLANCDRLRLQSEWWMDFYLYANAGSQIATIVLGAVATVIVAYQSGNSNKTWKLVAIICTTALSVVSSSTGVFRTRENYYAFMELATDVLKSRNEVVFKISQNKDLNNDPSFMASVNDNYIKFVMRKNSILGAFNSQASANR